MKARWARRAVCSMAVTAAAGALAPGAGAATASLGTLPATADRLTAYGGWVLFSERSARGDWSLMAWHAGSIVALPVPARSIPFDAEAGPGADGHAAAVFSKCVREPRVRGGEGQMLAAAVEWQTASGCRIYELSLPGGTPRLLARIRPPRGSSDATPAIWRGEVAFARYGRAGPPQLLLSGTRNVRHLGGGPSSCPAPSTISEAPLCRRHERLLRSRVTGISLSAGAAVYEWVAEVPGSFVGPSADPEIRIDPLRSGAQSAPTKLLEMRFASGACGGSWSGSPNAVAGKALYLRTAYACEAGPERLTSSFEIAPPVGRVRSSGTGGHILALALAWDSGTAYWLGLVPSPPAACTGNPACQRERTAGQPCPPQSVCETARPLPAQFGCEPAEGACTLMRTTGLAAASSVGAAGKRRGAVSRPGAARH